MRTRNIILVSVWLIVLASISFGQSRPRPITCGMAPRASHQSNPQAWNSQREEAIRTAPPHEIGHAIVSLALGGWLTGINMHGNGNANCDCGSYNRSKMAVIYAAGYAANMLLNGESQGHGNDWALSEEFAHPINNDDIDRAMQILRNNWTAFQILSAEAPTRGHMSGSRIRAIYQQYRGQGAYQDQGRHVRQPQEQGGRGSRGQSWGEWWDDLWKGPAPAEPVDILPGPTEGRRRASSAEFQANCKRRGGQLMPDGSCHYY